MKKSKSLTALTILLPAIACLTACQKGEEILDTPYGDIATTATFSGAATPVLVQVDGETRDTLTLQRPGGTIPGNIIVHPGDRKFTLVKLEGQTVIFETILKVETGKTTNAPRFLYDGISTLFDDQTSKPAKDSMLVRFINQVPTFPAVIDLEIRVNSSSNSSINELVKTIKSVGKDKFSDFVQLPNPAHLKPGVSGIRYIVEATDPATNTKLLSLQSGKYAPLSGVVTGQFTPNGVTSVGLQPPSRGNIYRATNIFERVAE